MKKNQRVEKEMKNEKLEITSETIMLLPEVLRNSKTTVEDSETDNNEVSTFDEEIENRRKISLKLIEKIRRNNRQMINAKTFLERPYYAGNVPFSKKRTEKSE